MRRPLVTALLVAGLLVTPGVARASHIGGFVDCATNPVAVNLFAPGPGCTIDDKLFFNFGVTAGEGDISQFVTVTSVADGDILREEIQFGFPALPIGVNITLPIVIAYSVQALDPLFALTDIHLGLNADTFGLVTETVTLANGTVIVLTAGTDPLEGFLGLTDEAFFSGVGALAVVKVVETVAFGQGGTINQAVTEQAVPEPASLLLLGTGLAVVARRFWKRASQAA